MDKLRDFFAVMACGMWSMFGVMMLLSGQHEAPASVVMGTVGERVLALALFVVGGAGAVLALVMQARRERSEEGR